MSFPQWVVWPNWNLSSQWLKFFMHPENHFIFSTVDSIDSNSEDVVPPTPPQWVLALDTPEHLQVQRVPVTTSTKTCPTPPATVMAPTLTPTLTPTPTPTVTPAPATLMAATATVTWPTTAQADDVNNCCTIPALSWAGSESSIHIEERQRQPKMAMTATLPVWQSGNCDAGGGRGKEGDEGKRSD